MTQDRDLDVQAQQILQGLRILGELLDKPVARDALDLNKNATTSARYEVLGRLCKSLRQYLERGGDLFYAGLLGHFSAGKSSTINSLLGAWQTKHERPSGLNPTDTTITLITQEKNSGSLLGIIREGHVSIRYHAVENPILESLVLVDTPGTGDPQILQEIARDFLPICDVILFLFSAASPLDQADLPLLSELHNRLQFIPIHFVITRADELRRDTLRPLSDENLDEGKKEQFLKEVLDRVNSLLKPSIYTSEQFILVDNKAGYNIEVLRKLLESRFSLSGPRARVTMHANKLHYYTSGAKELRNFFAEFLETKLAELNKIVAAARRNIQRYNEIVRISNSNLTKAWLDRVALMNGARARAVEKLKRLDPPPVHYSAFPSVARKQSEVSEDLTRDAKFAAGSISARLNTVLLPSLQEHLRKAEASIALVGLDQLTATSHGIKSTALEFAIEEVDSVPYRTLTRKYADVRSSQADALQEALGDLRRTAREIDELLQANVPFGEFEKIIAAAQESLAADLNQFFQNVELYRSGVFSHTTKESIATLGIGSRLDELESEFAEDDRSSYTAEAIADLFPGATELAVKSATETSSISAKVRGVIDALRALKVEKLDDAYPEIETAASAERSAFHNEISRQAQADVDRICENVALKLAALLVNTRSSYDTEMRAAASARRRHYFLIVTTASLIALSLFFGYRYLASTAPQSIFQTIMWGLTSTLLGNAVGFLVARFRDTYPDTTRKIKQRFSVMLREEVHKAVDAETQSHRFEVLNEGYLGGRLRTIYNDVILPPTDPWQVKANEYLRSIRDLYVQLESVRGNYVGLIDDIHRQATRYFTDATKNLEILNTIAGKIKERTIEPSFTLLDETQRQLEYVKKEIESVEFA
jgi:predicted GTPase